MAVTAAQLTQLYLAYFGRPPDFDGITFYTSNPAATTTSVAAAFSASPESVALFGPTFNAAQINAIYQNLFNRDAEPAGLTYWSTEVAAGRITPAGASLAILQGAQNADKTAADNKLAIATSFYGQLDTTAEITGYSGTAAAASARAFLKTVADTAASVTAAQTGLGTAVAAAVAQGPIAGVPGVTSSLTLNQDTLVGGSANDVFNATIALDGAGAPKDTLTGIDSIDGGAGTDTLNATISANVAATIKNVEIINTRFTGAVSMDLTNATGVSNITVADSTAGGTVKAVGAVSALTVRNQNQDVTLAGNTATTLALVTESFGSATANKTVTLDNKATSATVTTNAGYTTVATVAGLTTVTVAATGANNLDVFASAGALKTVTVTGSGTLTLSGGNYNKVTKLDAGVNTGGVTATVDAAAVTVTGGSGKDSITFGAAIAATAKVDLGAGNDTLTIAAATAAGATVAGGEGTDTLAITDGTFLAGGSKIYTGFETLEVGGGKGNYDMDQLTTLTAVTLSTTDLAGNIDIQNAAAGTTLTLNSKKANDFAVTKDVTYTLKTATGKTDSLSVTLNAVDGDNDSTADGNITAAKIVAAGIETITLTSNATVDTGVAATKYTNTITALTADAVTTLNVAGAANTTITTLTAATITKIDASTATGAVSVSAANAAQAVVFLGGTGDDVVTSSKFGDTINAGKGADAITLTATSAQTDTLILKAGDSNLTATGKGIDSVTNFSKAGETLDVIDVTAFGFTGTARALGVKGVLAATAVDGSVLSVTDFFDVGGVDRGVAVGTIGADSYVFIDANKDGNFTAADDLLVKITANVTLANGNFAF